MANIYFDILYKFRSSSKFVKPYSDDIMLCVTKRDFDNLFEKYKNDENFPYDQNDWFFQRYMIEHLFDRCLARYQYEEFFLTFKNFHNQTYIQPYLEAAKEQIRLRSSNPLWIRVLIFGILTFVSVLAFIFITKPIGDTIGESWTAPVALLSVCIEGGLIIFGMVFMISPKLIIKFFKE